MRDCVTINKWPTFGEGARGRLEAEQRQAGGRHSFRIMRQWLFHRCGRILKLNYLA